MAISVDWAPRIIYVPKAAMVLVQTLPTEIRRLDLNTFRLWLKDHEDSEQGMSFPDTHRHNTVVTVGGVELARVVEIINDYTVTFEDGQYAVDLIGANSNVGDRVNVNQVSVRSANSAGLVTSQAIEAGEFDYRVAVDIIKGESGTIYPIGTFRRPSNNIPDAVLIAKARGFNELYIVGSLHTNDISHDISGFKLSGSSHVGSILTVGPDTICARTNFVNFDITGTLDGDSEIVDCIIRDLEYFDGHIHNSKIAGVIKFSGNNEASINSCSALSMSNPPHIDFNHSTQTLSMPNWSGPVIIDNFTVNNIKASGIGVDAGKITVMPSCTAGTLAMSGNGELIDNSGPDFYVVNSMIDGVVMNTLQRTVEFLRPHHTSTGIMYFWDPHTGNDDWDGRTVNRAVKTFAKAHSLTKNANHDTIMCVSGNPMGLTVATEAIVLSNDYTFLRGPGRDFNIVAPDDLTDTITITGRGVEVSGMRVSSRLNSAKHAIVSRGNFTLIKHVDIFESHNGISIEDGEYSILDSVNMHHGSGYGLYIGLNSEHTTVQDCHIGNNTGDGVLIESVHEVDISKTIIHGNTGFGIHIKPSASSVIISRDTEIFNNLAGSVNDEGSGTAYHKNVSDKSVWEYVSRTLTAASSSSLTAEQNTTLMFTKYTHKSIYVDLNEANNGEGFQGSPFNNISDAINFGETNGIKDIRLQSEVVLDRNVKNVTITGIGLQKVECNDPELKNTEFKHIQLSGTYTNSIMAEDCTLEGTASVTTMIGDFVRCVVGGEFIIPDGTNTLIRHSTSYVGGLTKPIFDIGGALGTARLEFAGHSGGVTIINCNQPTDDVKFIGTGIVEIDSSCVDGVVVVVGLVKPIDNSGPSCTVYWLSVDPEDIKDVAEMLGVSKGNPITLGNGKHLSNNIDVTVTNNGDGTHTLDRQ